MRIAGTGAFGFSGKSIARRLLDLKHEVITLTDSPHRTNLFGKSVKAFPYHFCFRSSISSRSNWAIDLSTLRISLPVGVAVSRFIFSHPQTGTLGFQGAAWAFT